MRISKEHWENVMQTTITSPLKKATNITLSADVLADAKELSNNNLNKLGISLILSPWMRWR